MVRMLYYCEVCMMYDPFEQRAGVMNRISYTQLPVDDDAAADVGTFSTSTSSPCLSPDRFPRTCDVITVPPRDLSAEDETAATSSEDAGRACDFVYMLV